MDGIRIYLVRHAQTPYNVDDIFIGGRSVHLPLTKKGQLQAKKVGARFKDEGLSFDRIYSSSALRAKETAKAISHKLKYSLENIVITDELLEKHQGDWEGKVRTEYYTPEVISLMQKDPANFSPPNGESPSQVGKRMLGFIEKEILPKKTGSYLCVSHGYAIKALFTEIFSGSYGMTHKIELKNTSITEFHYDRTGWHILRVNDVSHLKYLN